MPGDVLTTDDGQVIVSDREKAPIHVDSGAAWITQVEATCGSINDVVASAIALMTRLSGRIDAATNFARLMGATPKQLAPVTRLTSAIIDNRTQLARAVSENTGR